jgi:hypothetical protein
MCGQILELDMFLDSRYKAAVMSNYDRGATPVQNKIRELLGRTLQP